MNDYRQYPTSTAVYTGEKTAYATSGYAQVDAPTPAQPRFELLADRLANLPDVAHKAISRLRAIADRYGGTMPEAVGKSDGHVEPNSLAARLDQSVMTLDNLLGQIHAQIDRLERF